MSRNIVLTFIVLLACGIGMLAGILLITIGDRDTLYPQSMVVVQIDNATDTVTCEDATGNLWQFKGVEDWYVGDIAAMIMDSKGTTEIYDDEIVNVQYCGTTLDAEG